MTQITFWYEFASTYSYPSVMRIEAEASKIGVQVVWRPFLLGPIFGAQGWDTSPFNIYPAKGNYMWRDLQRICADLDLPFCRPDSFPQNGLMAARLATHGMSEGWGVAFSKAVFDAQFGKGERIDNDETLSKLLVLCGADPGHAMQAAQSAAIKGALRKATTQAAEMGLFGAPSFATEDQEIFWGNDRLDHALRWARKSA